MTSRMVRNHVHGLQGTCLTMNSPGSLPCLSTEFRGLDLQPERPQLRMCNPAAFLHGWPRCKRWGLSMHAGQPKRARVNVRSGLEMRLDSTGKFYPRPHGSRSVSSCNPAPCWILCEEIIILDPSVSGLCSSKLRTS